MIITYVVKLNTKKERKRAENLENNLDHHTINENERIKVSNNYYCI